MNLTLTDRQLTILSISLTMMYDEIGKSGEGKQMMQEVSELHKTIVNLQVPNLEAR